MGEVMVDDSKIEKLLTPQELAAQWKRHPSTIQRMFKDEPGVVVFGQEDRRDGKRDYTTILIPASVARRYLERHTR